MPRPVRAREEPQRTWEEGPYSLRYARVTQAELDEEFEELRRPARCRAGVEYEGHRGCSGSFFRWSDVRISRIRLSDGLHE